MYTLSLSAPVPSLTYHVALFWFSSKSLLLLKVTIDAALIILITHHVCFNLRLVSSILELFFFIFDGCYAVSQYSPPSPSSLITPGSC